MCIYCTFVRGKPKFIKYDNNNGGNEEDDKLPQKTGNKTTKETENRKVGESIKFEEEDKIEFVRGEGRPDNFLG